MIERGRRDQPLHRRVYRSIGGADQHQRHEVCPASIPFFAAQTTFKGVQAQSPEYTYQEPALNPTNLNDRPSGWKADYINAVRNKAGSKEQTGLRDTPAGSCGAWFGRSRRIRRTGWPATAPQHFGITRLPHSSAMPGGAMVGAPSYVARSS